jgi:hypothetical protein
MLKNILILIVLVVIFMSPLHAQKIPSSIPFQAIAKDYAGAPANERKIYIQTNLIAGNITGKTVFTELHETTTDERGVFSIMIGAGKKTAGGLQSLNELDWEEGPYFLGIQLAILPYAPVQGWQYENNWINMGTTSLGIVPYAFYATQTSGLQAKLNASDTAQMLRYYVKNTVIKLLDSAIGSKLSFKDTLAMLAPYTKASTSDTIIKNVSNTYSVYQDYDSLKNKPILFSKEYDSLLNKPVLFNKEYDSLLNKPVLFDGNYNSLSNQPLLFNGDYNSLTNLPTLRLNGDITSVGDATTLSISGVASGTYGSSLTIPSITVDAKGRIIAASNSTITPNNFPNKTNTEKNALPISTTTGTVIWCTDCGTRGQLQVFNGTEWTDLTGGTALVPGIVFIALNISTITSSTASADAGISSDGGALITAKGVVWSTSVNPTIALTTKTNDGTGTGNFTSSLITLSASTLYYVRAYATNSNGTVYGVQQSFSTLGVVPTISTTAASSISLATATTGGNITSDGGTTIVSRGICWSLSANPTINDNKLINGNGTGNYTINLTGLNAGTTYYIRAYATNAAGTGYGAQVSFNTSSIALGVSYLGGKIAYIFQAGDVGYVTGQTHGFIIMNHAMGIQVRYSNNGAYSNTSMNFGTGKNNTSLLFNLTTTELNAAKYVYNVLYDGYSDWYIPSYYEWNKIAPAWTQLGLADGNYHSSSERDSGYYFTMAFFGGGTSYQSRQSVKTDNAGVIGIRKF